MPMSETLSQAVVKLRQHLGISQGELASEARCSQPTISALEPGSVPAAENSGLEEILRTLERLGARRVAAATSPWLPVAAGLALSQEFGPGRRGSRYQSRQIVRTTLPNGRFSIR